MRHLLGILLLFCLAAPIVGTYAGLRIERKRVRKEVKNRLLAGVPDTALVHLQFSRHAAETSLRWEHACEFEYRGQMYDVVKSAWQDDTLRLWCWLDRAETELNRKTRLLVAQGMSKNPLAQDKERRLALFFLGLFFNGTAPAPSCFAAPGRLPLPQARALPLGAETAPPPSPPPDEGACCFSRRT